MPKTHKATKLHAIEEEDLLRDLVFDQIAAFVERLAEGEHSLSLSQVMEVVALFADVAEEVFPEVDAKAGLADLLRGCASDYILDNAADFMLIALADLK